MTRKDRERVSHEDVKAMRRVIQWLKTIGRLDDLQHVVADDLANIADEALVSRGVISVRVKNLGTPPSEKQRAILGRARAKKFGYAAPEWAPDADARLRYLWGETATPALEIAEEFGRSLIAIRQRAGLLGVPRNALVEPRVHPRITPLGRARLVIARRRAAEALQAREAAFDD